MKHFAIALCLCLAAGWVRAEDKATLKDNKDKTSYGMGFNIGSSWKRSNIEASDVDLDVFMKGLRDAMEGHEPLLNDKENREILGAFQTTLRARREEKRKILGEKNKKEGEEFLAANKSKPGVQTLPDGLQYKIITEGKGPKPTTNDTVSVNYRGTLVDGTEFDSSYKRGQPAKFHVTGVIKGWTEALLMMPVGSKWQLVIPPALAYGERGSGMTIGPNATLIFEVELLSIETPEKTAAAQPQNAQPITSDIIKVPSAEELKKGAKIEIIKPDQIEKEKQKAEQQQQKQQNK